MAAPARRLLRWEQPSAASGTTKPSCWCLWTGPLPLGRGRIFRAVDEAGPVACPTRTIVPWSLELMGSPRESLSPAIE